LGKEEVLLENVKVFELSYYFYDQEEKNIFGKENGIEKSSL